MLDDELCSHKIKAVKNKCHRDLLNVGKIIIGNQVNVSKTKVMLINEKLLFDENYGYFFSVDQKLAK